MDFSLEIKFSEWTILNYKTDIEFMASYTGAGRGSDL